MKKGLMFLVAFALFLGQAAPSSVIAKGKAAPKTTGRVGYTIGYQRYVEFNAIQDPVACSDLWDMSGKWTLDYE